jgi:hypothetical protein
MFRAMFSPIFRNNLTVYTALVQCTEPLPIGDPVLTVHCAKAVYTVKLFLKMGENIARNM